MAVGDKEQDWAHRARRFLRAEIKRAEISYAELAERHDRGTPKIDIPISNMGVFSLTGNLPFPILFGRRIPNLIDAAALPPLSSRPDAHGSVRRAHAGRGGRARLYPAALAGQ